MFIGLDLGTSGLRALLVDDTARPVAATEAHYDVSHPHDGWSEQDPADWIKALGQVMAALARDHASALSQVRGLAISGHMHGAVLLDDAGHVLRPCILWNDTRAHAEAATLDQTAGVREKSGNIVFPGFTAPKLAWVAAHEPALFDRVATVMLPKDYLVFHLTGARASEMSDAAGTAWLDTARRAWSEPLLAAGGMRKGQMPKLHEGSAPVGPMRPDVAAELGLLPETLIVAGGADNAAAACGVGAMGEGDAFVSLGTSGVMLAGRDRYAPAPESAVHTFCHAVPERWYQMGVVLAATDCMNWLSRITGRDPAALTGALGDTLLPPGPVQFFPYLSGERTPHNDSHIRGGLSGIGVAAGPEDLTRAVMEGVCFAIRDSFEALKSTGVKLESALIIGGGAASDLWVRMMATALDLPLEKPAQGEFGAALGAARLAICGVTGATPADVMTKPPIAAVIEPETALRDPFDLAYDKFRAGYPTLKALQ